MRMTARKLRWRLAGWRSRHGNLHLLATPIDTEDVSTMTVASCDHRRMRGRRTGRHGLRLGHDVSENQQQRSEHVEIPEG